MALAAVGFLPAAAASQVPPPSAQPRPQSVNAPSASPAAPKPALTVTGGYSRLPCPLLAPSYSAAEFALKHVDFEAPSEIDVSMFSDVVASHLNTRVAPMEVCRLRDAATDTLVRQGFVADVRIPPQDLTSGNVRMQVLVARLAAINVRGDAANAQDRIAALLQPLQGKLLNLKSLERQLLLVDELPGYDVTLKLKPIENGAEGDLAGVLYVRFRPVESLLSVDNFDEAYDAAAFGRVNFNGVLGGADQLTLGAYRSSNLRGLKGLVIGARKVSSGGVELAARATHIVSSDVLPGDASIRTRAWFATGEIQLPLKFMPAETVRVGVGFEYVDFAASLDSIPLVKDRHRVAFARMHLRRRGYQIDRETLASRTVWDGSATFEVRRGLNVLGATRKCIPISLCLLDSTPPSRVEANPTATVLRGSGTLQWMPTARLSLRAAAAGQYSWAPLLSVEEFVGGNFSIGRGYGATLLRGDRAAAVQFEAQYGATIAPQGHWRVLGLAFVDAVKVHHLGQLAPLREPTALSVGGGLRLLAGTRFSGQLLAAVPLTVFPAEFPRRKPRVLCAASYLF